MADTRLKMAFVGCGGIARAHLQGIQRTARRIDVTAVVDSNAEAANTLAAATGAEAFADIDTALAQGEFDAVDIMLPHDLHEMAALKCFRAAKHVLMEKPLAHDLESCERILAAARECETTFMVAEQSQYWPDIIRARELMDQGAIGSILNASGNFYDRIQLDPDAPRPWRFDLKRSGGGVSIDGGAHWIRPLRMLLGEIDEVITVMGSHVPQMEGESWSQSLFRFDNGATAVLTCLNVTTTAAPVEMFRVTGSGGELQITGGREGELRLFNAEHPKGYSVMPATLGKLNSYGAELKDFEEVILDGKTMAAPPEAALGEFRTALAMYRSTRSKRWEKVWQ